ALPGTLFEVDKPLRITVTATPAANISQLTLTAVQDERNVLASSSSGSLSVTWVPHTVGNVTLEADALDNTGLHSIADFSVRVIPPNNPPVVTLISPTNGTVLARGSTVVVQALATDPDPGQTISKVEISFNGSLRGTITSPINSIYAGNFFGLSPGSYAI